MADISQRLRFEILRRDGYACYYCGRKPPEVPLEVDAVVPEALGGSHKDPANLVTACKPCNGGKSSSSPDAPLVAAVADDAAKWAEAVQAAADGMRTEVAASKEACESFDDAWNSDLADCWRPDDWEKSILAFLRSGLLPEVLEDCVTVAARSRAPRHAKWRYMCKVAWSRIAEIRDQAHALANGTQGIRAVPTEAAYKQGRLSLAKELLDDMTDEEREHYLDHADYSDYAEEPLTEEEIACGAVSSALNGVRCELDYLCRRVEETLRGLPDGAGDRALATPGDSLLKLCSPLGRRSMFLADALYKADDYLQLPAARALLDALSDEERGKWLEYAHALCHKARDLDDDRWLVRAANCARVIKDGRYWPEMCEGPGDLIRLCPTRSEYHVKIAKCCDSDGSEHEDHRFCARHTEMLVDGRLTDSTGRQYTAVDYTPVSDSELVPF